MQLYNEFLLIARDCSVDEADKMFSIFKIVDRFIFNIGKLPAGVTISPSKPFAFPIKYIVVSSWGIIDDLKNDTSFEVKATLLDPDEKQLSEIVENITVPAHSDRIRVNFDSSLLQCTTSGQYEIRMELLHDNKKIARSFYRFKVEITENSTP